MSEPLERGEIGEPAPVLQEEIEKELEVAHIGRAGVDRQAALGLQPALPSGDRLGEVGRGREAV